MEQDTLNADEIVQAIRDYLESSRANDTARDAAHDLGRNERKANERLPEYKDVSTLDKKLDRETNPAHLEKIREHLKTAVDRYTIAISEAPESRRLAHERARAHQRYAKAQDAMEGAWRRLCNVMPKEVVLRLREEGALYS